MNRMAESDACKDSLTHMSYDFAESQRSLTGFAGIIMQNSRGGHALPGKMSVRTGPSEGPLLQRRPDNNMGGHSIFFSKPRKFTKKSNRRMWVMLSVCTICSELGLRDCRVSFQNKSKGKVEALNSDTGSLPASVTGISAQPLSFLQALPVTRIRSGFPVTHPASETLRLTEGLGCEDLHLDTRQRHKNPTGFPQRSHRIASNCRRAHM